MAHDWIFEVLSDLKAYALANGLPGLAAKAEEALAVARAELAQAGEHSAVPQDGLPPGRKSH